MSEATFPDRPEKRQFWQTPLYCAGAVVLIHAVPKPEWAALRFVLTAAYFTAVLHLLWHVATQLPDYLYAAYAQQFEDSGPALERVWRRYVLSLVKAVRIGLALVASIVLGAALKVLGLWVAAAAPLRPLGQLLLWAGVAGLMLSPRIFRSVFQEVLQRRRVLKDEIGTCGFTREPADVGEESSKEKPGRAVAVTGPYRFMAGGYEWLWEDFYKNAIVFGQSGTGKTVCVMNALLDGMLASSAGREEEKPGGLILDPKGDFRDKIRHLCRQHGREGDLVVLDAANRASEIRWNPFDNEDDVGQLAGRFAAVMQSTGVKVGEDTFWVDSAKQFVTNALELLRLTNEAGEPASFRQILELSRSKEAIASRAARIADGDPRADLCLEYLAEEWSTMPAETRSGIQAHISNMVSPFVREPFATTFSGRSSIGMNEIVEGGKILYVYLPIAEREDVARIICTFVKLAFQREVLRRPRKRRRFFLSDEFQAFLTTFPGYGDSDFFERSRQSNHANLVATQNLPALTKGLDKDDAVHNLLGNCSVKLFLRNTDRATNEYASKLFGERLVAVAGAAHSARNRSESASGQYDAKRRPESFSALGVPFPAQGIRHCEAIVHLTSREAIVDKKLQWQIHPLVS